MVELAIELRKPQFWVSLGVAVFWTYFMVTAQIFVDNNSPPNGQLPDLGFQAIPDVNLGFRPEDIILGVLALATLVYFVVVGRFVMVLRRYFTILAFFFWIRGAWIMVTRLPSPNSLCTQLVSTAPYLDAFRVVGFVANTCNDLTVSGHTFNMITFALIWTEYTGWFAVHLLFWLAAIAGQLTIIANRFHYTMDVFAANVVGILLWQKYHIVLDALENGRKTPYWFIEWLETHYLQKLSEREYVGKSQVKGYGKTMKDYSV